LLRPAPPAFRQNIAFVSPVFGTLLESLLPPLIHDAGWPIWLLLATSVLGLALIIDRLLALRRARVAPPCVANEAIELLRHDHLPPHALARLQASPLGYVLAEAIRQRAAPHEVQRLAVEDTGRRVAQQLGRSLSMLGTVAAIAPLLGLFGTVVGMIEIFASYTPADGQSGGNPAQLARGISVALYNTGFGILIAVPALIAYRHFRARVDDYVCEMEGEAARLLRLAAVKTVNRQDAAA